MEGGKEKGMEEKREGGRGGGPFNILFLTFRQRPPLAM